MKNTYDGHRIEGEGIRAELKSFAGWLKEMHDATPYAASLDKDLARKGVDKAFLNLVEDIRKTEKLKLQIMCSVPHAVEMTREEYSEIVRAKRLEEILLMLVKAIWMDDSDFFLKLVKAMDYKFTGKEAWKIIYHEWVVWRDVTGRDPTCSELLECVNPRLAIESGTLLYLCKRHNLGLSKAKVGRPPKSKSKKY